MQSFIVSLKSTHKYNYRILYSILCFIQRWMPILANKCIHKGYYNTCAKNETRVILNSLQLYVYCNEI